jgi:hypothetical protein
MPKRVNRITLRALYSDDVRRIPLAGLGKVKRTGRFAPRRLSLMPARPPVQPGSAFKAAVRAVPRNQKKPASEPNPLNQFGLRRVQSPVGSPLLLLVGVMYFHDKGTNRRVMLIGLMFCTAFVLVSFFARPQPENDRVLVKADRLTLTAGKPPLAN